MHRFNSLKRMTSMLLIALTVALPVIITTGCGTSELIADINTAQAVVQSASSILSTSNPAIGASMVKVGNDLGLLSTLVSQYDRSVSAGKPGIGTQIQAVTSELTSNLGVVLSAVHVQNPELIEYITVAVAIANSTITIVLQHLPTTTPAAASAQAATLSAAQTLPNVEFKSHKDLKTIWNTKVAGTKYATSKVR